jgi:hypothetical protein
MPEAAAANRSVFFDDTGRAHSRGEIYDTFAPRIDADAARFAKARPESAGDAPAFMRGVGFSATRLSPPIAAGRRYAAAQPFAREAGSRSC